MRRDPSADRRLRAQVIGKRRQDPSDPSGKEDAEVVSTTEADGSLRASTGQVLSGTRSRGPATSDRIPRTLRGKRTRKPFRRQKRKGALGRPPAKSFRGLGWEVLPKQTEKRPPTLRGRRPKRTLRRPRRQRQGLRAEPVPATAFGQRLGSVYRGDPGSRHPQAFGQRERSRRSFGGSDIVWGAFGHSGQARTFGSASGTVSNARPLLLGAADDGWTLRGPAGRVLERPRTHWHRQHRYRTKPLG